MPSRLLSVIAVSVTLILIHAAGLAAAAEPVPRPDYAAWRKVNKDGSWTAAAERAVQGTSLATLVPKDVQTFCPAYAGLDAAQRTRFWAGLLSAMARPESNFKPNTVYVEPDIRDADRQSVMSRGLLQISIESANQKAYSCAIKKAEDLHKVDVNLNCAARIMRYLVEKDGVVAAAAKPAVGGARYWSVLRAWRGHIDEIGGFTRGLDVCKS